MTTKRVATNRCTICQHPERSRIEHLMAAGASKRSIAERFAVGQDAAWRHFTNHVSPAMKSAALANTLKPGVELDQLLTEEATGLLQHLANIRSKLYHAFDASLEAGDRNATAILAGRLLESLRFLSELTGRLQKYHAPTHVTTINVLNSPQFLTVQAKLIEALAPYEDARRAVICAFRELETADAALLGLPEPNLAG